jgi:hypothetical protein
MGTVILGVVPHELRSVQAWTLINQIAFRTAQIAKQAGQVMHAVLGA